MNATLRALLAEDKGDGAGGGTTALTQAGVGEGDQTATGEGDKGADAGAKAAADKAALEKTAADKVASEKAAKEAKETWAKWSPKPVDGLKRDDASLGKLRELAAKHGLKPEAAQDLVDFNDELSKAAEKTRAEELDQTLAGWKDTIKADKEFGGAKLAETHADVARVMKKFGESKELRKMLDETGWGDHPELVKFVARIGKSMREDSLPSGAGNGTAKAKTLPELLYGSPPKS